MPFGPRKKVFDGTDFVEIIDIGPDEDLIESLGRHQRKIIRYLKTHEKATSKELGFVVFGFEVSPKTYKTKYVMKIREKLIQQKYTSTLKTTYLTCS